MDEHQFWDVIGTLRGEADAAALERYTERLTALSDHEVVAFGDTLSAKLYALDTVAHFEQPILADDSEPEDMDPDLFDDLRCAVVLAGPDVYAAVLNRPEALAERRWPHLWDAGSIVDTLDAVHVVRSIGTGNYSPKFPLTTGSNPLGFREDPGSPPASDEWLLLGHSLEDDDFVARWHTSGRWPEFDTPVRAALHDLEDDATRRAAFAALGVKRIVIGLNLYPAAHKPGIRVRRVADELEVDVTTHFGLDDPTSEEIRSWAATELTAALDVALARASKKA